MAPLLIEGLRRLEYRGYDSVGIATLMDGCIGIAHTRWAAHGVPNETNAHPVATDCEARADRGAGTAG